MDDRLRLKVCDSASRSGPKPRILASPNRKDASPKSFDRSPNNLIHWLITSRQWRRNSDQWSDNVIHWRGNPSAWIFIARHASANMVDASELARHPSNGRGKSMPGAFSSFHKNATETAQNRSLATPGEMWHTLGQ